MAEYIRLKNDPEYYNDPVCKHGYLRGSETFNYVREVMERYNYYLTKTIFCVKIKNRIKPGGNFIGRE